MQQGKREKNIDSLLSFHLMKFAFQDFQKSTCRLTDQEYTQAYQHANEEMLLHQLILSSEEACCVVIPEAIQKKTLQGVIAEYPNNALFHTTLQENNICLEDYMVALHNDLRVETVLARVASTVQSVTSAEMLHYFCKNRTQFSQPELRNANHIQVLFNPSSPSERKAAFKRITAIHNRVCKNPKCFSEEAKLFSDCSTKNEDGNLGTLAVGELCPVLDKALFSLQAGEVSPVIESSSGFNILYCSTIHPANSINFHEVSPAIFSTLLKKKQLEACRLWLQTVVQAI